MTELCDKTEQKLIPSRAPSAVASKRVTNPVTFKNVFTTRPTDINPAWRGRGARGAGGRTRIVINTKRNIIESDSTLPGLYIELMPE
ncbi:hypothetical protein EVAR_62170_1 [Eumeta japonica]|uniref:Uncharacterized protein n=1 Tax=Eumeta variegata TaxID=151549 RepID=A0A4C1ZR92_EUMVA|nr:hypothetical protein EVAR_62170_1 [Eumeta japonica]